MVIDFTKDGYYIVRPEHTSLADIAASFVPASEPLDLKTLQAAVGGYIERVQLCSLGYEQKPGGLMGFHFAPRPGDVEVNAFVNEEGKLEGLPINDFATAIVRRLSYIEEIGIAGNMIIVCGKAEEPPESEEDD